MKALQYPEVEKRDIAQIVDPQTIYLGRYGAYDFYVEQKAIAYASVIIFGETERKAMDLEDSIIQDAMVAYIGDDDDETCELMEHYNRSIAYAIRQRAKEILEGDLI